MTSMTAEWLCSLHSNQTLFLNCMHYPQSSAYFGSPIMLCVRYEHNEIAWSSFSNECETSIIVKQLLNTFEPRSRKTGFNACA
jgi:hypothetical protein